MREIVLYTKPGCHLCAETRLTLDALLVERRLAGLEAPAVEERDISLEPAWERAYFGEVPVVAVGDRELPLATSPSRLRRFLDEALTAPVAS
jgi:glutaredoxin